MGARPASSGVSWLERIRPGEAQTREEEAPDDGRQERSAPGLAALFESLYADGRHTILDFGSAESRRFRLLGRFGRKIRFADIVPEVPRGPAFQAALDRMRPQDGEAYDVVLAWDVFDRLSTSERARCMECIAEVTAPGARLYAVVDSAEAVTRRPVRWSVLGLDRVAAEPVGAPEPAHPPLLPRQVEQLLEPFEVVTAVSLKGGLREYMARRDA